MEEMFQCIFFLKKKNLLIIIMITIIIIIRMGVQQQQFVVIVVVVLVVINRCIRLSSINTLYRKFQPQNKKKQNFFVCMFFFFLKKKKVPKNFFLFWFIKKKKKNVCQSTRPYFVNSCLIFFLVDYFLFGFLYHSLSVDGIAFFAFCILHFAFCIFFSFLNTRLVIIVQLTLWSRPGVEDYYHYTIPWYLFFLIQGLQFYGLFNLVIIFFILGRAATIYKCNSINSYVEVKSPR